MRRGCEGGFSKRPNLTGQNTFRAQKTSFPVSRSLSHSLSNSLLKALSTKLCNNLHCSAIAGPTLGGILAQHLGFPWASGVSLFYLWCPFSSAICGVVRCKGVVIKAPCTGERIRLGLIPNWGG